MSLSSTAKMKQEIRRWNGFWTRALVVAAEMIPFDALLSSILKQQIKRHSISSIVFTPILSPTRTLSFSGCESLSLTHTSKNLNSFLTPTHAYLLHLNLTLSFFISSSLLTFIPLFISFLSWDEESKLNLQTSASSWNTFLLFLGESSA